MRWSILFGTQPYWLCGQGPWWPLCAESAPSAQAVSLCS